MTCGRSVRSLVIEGEASKPSRAMSPHLQSTLPTQTAPTRYTASTSQPQNEVVPQLLPTLMAIHEALELLAGNQTNQTPVSTSAPPVVEPVIDEPAQGVTPTNADNLSAARRLAGNSKAQAWYLIKAEIKAICKKERERASPHQHLST